MSAQPDMPDLGVTPADVAVWLRARTQDVNGRELGLFNEDTRPTVTQVLDTIEVAQSLVALHVGWDAPEACMFGYQRVVALQAACIIEKSYFPEQIQNRRSNYDELKDELADAKADLLRCITDGGLGPGGGEGVAAGAYSICTPPEGCGGVRLFVPANWDDPYAADVDDPTETGDRAVGWLQDRQGTWAGRIDQHGRPIPPAV